MAEDKDDEEGEDRGDEASAEEGEEGAPAKGGKTKLLLVVGVALLLVIGGLAGAYFGGLLDPLIGKMAGKEEAGPEGESPGVVFFDLPELIVNLNTGGTRRAAFLKIRVSLELEKKADVAKIEQVMPKIVDNFQVYLRELRVEDLKGSAGMYRLREELLTRVAAAAAPAKVNDVLFKEMLVQ